MYATFIAHMCPHLALRALLYCHFFMFVECPKKLLAVVMMKEFARSHMQEFMPFVLACLVCKWILWLALISLVTLLGVCCVGWSL